MEQFVSLLGLALIVGIAWAMSSNKRQMNWRYILTGMGLQVAVGIFILKTPAGLWLFQTAGDAVRALLSYSDAGAQFLFGDDFRDHFFAFSVLPTIIFVSSLMAVLFYLGVIQLIVRAMAWVMVKVMDASGTESLAAAANVFMGQTEAPLTIKPYLATMTRSELMALMAGGMATVAGGVMAAYVGMGIDAGHLLTASVMSAPAALVMAKIMQPETEESVTKAVVKVEVPCTDANLLDAACRGASEGLKLALNVGAMLIAFIAFIAAINGLLSLVGMVAGEPLTFQRMLGWLLAPLAVAMGVPFDDATKVGALLGQKTVTNEFVAYLDFVRMTKETPFASPRSELIATYALCGFANFSSIAIQIGGIGALVPERRAEFAKLGLRAMIAGTLACFMTACIASALMSDADLRERRAVHPEAVQTAPAQTQPQSKPAS